MRKGLVLVSLVAMAVGLTVFGSVQTGVFRVDGMDTDEDMRRVSASLKRTPGVVDALGDYRSQVVIVKYDDAKVRARDLYEAVDIAGFSLSPLDSPTGSQGTPVKNKTAKVLADFNSALSQTRTALEKEKYGLVRNLALALKVRRDAVTGLVKTAPPVKKGKTAEPGLVGGANSATQQLSKAVDAFAAAAEARNKAQVKDLFPTVKKAFRNVVEAYDLDAMIAAPTGTGTRTGKEAPQPEKSLEEQLKELSEKYL